MDFLRDIVDKFCCFDNNKINIICLTKNQIKDIIAREDNFDKVQYYVLDKIVDLITQNDIKTALKLSLVMFNDDIRFFCEKIVVLRREIVIDDIYYSQVIIFDGNKEHSDKIVLKLQIEFFDEEAEFICYDYIEEGESIIRQIFKGNDKLTDAIIHYRQKS